MQEFKTPPYEHQYEALRLSKDEVDFALLMEQGTGKSKVVVDTAAYMFRARRIDILIVIAPNGVHRNWVINEIPTHLPDDIDRRTAFWVSGPSKKHMATVEALLDTSFKGLRVFVINVDALVTADGIKILDRLLTSFKALLVMDESSRIKEPTARRTKAAVNISRKAVARRILTGTPVTQGPLDLFSQFQFLDPAILRCGSYYAFKAQYAELLPRDDGLMRHIMERMKRANPGKPVNPPQMIKEDKDGRPIYRNLDKLQKLIEPYSYRVLKSECLDLPEKIYKKAYVDLDPGQRRMYVSLRDNLRLRIGESLTVVSKMVAISRMQQVIGGYAPLDDGSMLPLFSDPRKNPRIIATLSLLSECYGKAIIWSRFRAEIRDIHHALSEEYGKDSVVQYHGDVSSDDRVEAVDRFQTDDKCRWFVGQPHSGGIGITLTAAELMVYYSNDYSLETRLQSEDRCHRIGLKHHVVYVDIEAVDTIDQKIVWALRNKKDVADLITGDPKLEWV